METQEEFCARMSAAQDAEFAELCETNPFISRLLAHAPSPRHADMLRSMLRMVFHRGYMLGGDKVIAEMEKLEGEVL